MAVKKPSRRSKLSKFGVFDPTTQTECAICTMEFETGDDISSPFACGHRFHRDCINAWINRRRNNRLNPNCPICKSEVLVGVVPLAIQPAENMDPIRDDAFFAAGGLAVEDEEQNVWEDYDSPPQRPDPVPRPNPGIPAERRRQILMDSRNEWVRYFNEFNLYNTLTRTPRSERRRQRDSTTLISTRDLIERLDQVLENLDTEGGNNDRNVRRRLSGEFERVGTEFGKRRVRSKKGSTITLNYINRALKYLSTI